MVGVGNGSEVLLTMTGDAGGPESGCDDEETGMAAAAAWGDGSGAL